MWNVLQIPQLLSHFQDLLLNAYLFLHSVSHHGGDLNLWLGELQPFLDMGFLLIASNQVSSLDS